MTFNELKDCITAHHGASGETILEISILSGSKRVIFPLMHVIYDSYRDSLVLSS